MGDLRKGDAEPYTKFRPSRFFKDGNEWYFFTREGTTEGPFDLRSEAENRLEHYIKVMTSGFMPSDSELSIEPLDTPKPH